MKKEMAVNISGTVLSSLFYDQALCQGDQTGFLLGDIVDQVMDTISDSQINNVEVKTKIYVFDCVPCPRDQIFYDARGEIQFKHLSDMLQDRKKNIVGWYRFRRNSTLRTSFREKLIHKNLIEALNVDASIFLFLLCSEKCAPNKSTHTFDHSFLCLINSVFKKMTVEIVNLGYTTHAEYKQHASHTVSTKHGAFSTIVKKQEKAFLNSLGCVDVTKIQCLNGALGQKLQEISQAVIDSETKCSELEQEVDGYRKRAKLRQLEREQELLKQQKIKDRDALKNGTKRLSIDDMLSIDGSDNLRVDLISCPTDLPRSQSLNINSHVHCMSATVSDMDIDERENLVNKFEYIKLIETKLSVPVMLHTCSSSPSVKTVTTTNSSESHIHTRSNCDNSPSCISNASGSTEPVDPFAFVTSIIVEKKLENKCKSKGDSTLSKNSERLKISDGLYLNTNIAMETDTSPVKIVSANKTSLNKNSEAAKYAAENLPEIPRKCKQKSSELSHGNQEVMGIRTKSNEKTDINVCSRGFGNKQKYDGNDKSGTPKNDCHKAGGEKFVNTEISTDAQSAEDKYEMQASSSPVY